MCVVESESYHKHIEMASRGKKMVELAMKKLAGLSNYPAPDTASEKRSNNAGLLELGHISVKVARLSVLPHTVTETPVEEPPNVVVTTDKEQPTAMATTVMVTSVSEPPIVVMATLPADEPTTVTVMDTLPVNEPPTVTVMAIHAADEPPIVMATPPVDEPPIVMATPPVDDPPTILAALPANEPPTVMATPPTDEPHIVMATPPVDEPPTVMATLPTVMATTPTDEPHIVMLTPPVDEPPTVMATPPTVMATTPTDEPHIVMPTPPADEPPTVLATPPADEPHIVMATPPTDEPATVLTTPPVDEPPIEDRVDSTTLSKKRRRTELQRQEYNKLKYHLLPPCPDKCRKSCYKLLSLKHRETVNHTYWSMTFGEKRLWLDGHILIKPVNSRAQATNDQYVRSHTLIYYLPTESGSKISVCKKMFLHTLGLKTDGTITEFVKSKLGNMSSITETADRRGKSEPSNKSNWGNIRDHINGYHPQVSHYTRERAPNRRYLDCNLSISDMWKDYNEKHPKVCYSVYRRVFEQENIGFGKPSQDECDVCIVYRAHVTTHSDTDDKSSCETCQHGERHLSAAGEARQAYKADASAEIQHNTSIFAVDMQRVILLPKMTTKEHLFVSRLVVFNETFASLTGSEDYVILWHEAIAGRLGINVASAYLKCISLSPEENVVFWADNCTGQNKNWALFTSLAMCVNQEWGPGKITMKFFERGHTFMRADNIHGTIGNKMKKMQEIHNFQNFVDLCDGAGKNIKPVVMHYSDFYLLQDGHRTRQSKNVVLPLLCTMCQVEFRKGHRSLFYKQRFLDDEFTEVEFLKPKFDIQAFPGVMTEPRGIPATKKEKLVALTDCYPPGKKKFWLEMQINNANKDLVQTFD